MAENKGVLPSSNVNTLGNANHKWENVYANKFTGALAGNASTASSAAQLTTARAINGTSFNGSANITTANWGTARNISIADSSATNTGTGVSVNGSGNVILKLPATIKASLTGNVTGNVSGSSSSCTGNSATSTKLNSRGRQTAITAKEEAGLYMHTVYNNGYPCAYGNVVTAGGDGGGQLLLGWSGADKGIEHLYYRNRRDAITSWSDWKTLAFTTDNVASATKATKDSAGQQINTTYIKGLSISNNALIYTKGNGTTGKVDLIPAGTVQMFAGNTIPAGWLLCDGSAVSRTNYAKLFSAIGTTWGAGDGSTTFNLPNSIGRFAEGASTSGSYKNAGLPNITGGFGANEAYWFARCGNIGALTAQNSFETNDRKYANALNPNSFSENFLGANYVSIDASKSSSVYGNSTTVQPPSFAVKYIIKY